MAPIQLQFLLCQGVLAQPDAGVAARPYGNRLLRDCNQVAVVQEDCHVAALRARALQDPGPTVTHVHLAGVAGAVPADLVYIDLLHQRYLQDSRISSHGGLIKHCGRCAQRTP